MTRNTPPKKRKEKCKQEKKADEVAWCIFMGALHASTCFNDKPGIMESPQYGTGGLLGFVKLFGVKQQLETSLNQDPVGNASIRKETMALD